MELGEKLQELRKSKGLTQEALAEALHVSRTAVSKWESGRGLPSIDSLKAIAAFFGVTVDDLLSAEKLITIAQKEHKKDLRSLYDLLFGVTDLFSLLLILLPLYPKTAAEGVWSVDLRAYTECPPLNRGIYWALFLGLVLLGLLRLILLRRQGEEVPRWLTGCSLALGGGAVVLPALAGETYAVVLAFLLLAVKGGLLLRRARTG